MVIDTGWGDVQAKARKKAGRAHQASTQNTQGSSAELAAAVQPEPAAPTTRNSKKNNKVLVQPSDGGRPDSGPAQMTQALPTSPVTDTTKPAHAAHAAEMAQHTAAVQMGGQVTDAGTGRLTTNGSAAHAAIRASHSTDAHIGTSGFSNTVAHVEDQAKSNPSAALLNMPIATSAQYLPAEGLSAPHMPSAAGAAAASMTGAVASAAMQKSDSIAAGLTAQDLTVVSRAQLTGRQGIKRMADDPFEADTYNKKAKSGENGSALHQGPSDHHDETSLWAEPMQLDSIVSCNHNMRRVLRRRAQN